MRHLNVATFRQNVGFLSVPPALWRGAATSHFRPREVYTSENGLQWERTPNTNAPLIAVFGHNVFVGSNWRGRLLRSTNAIDWKVIYQAEHHIEAIAFGDRH